MTNDYDNVLRQKNEIIKEQNTIIYQQTKTISELYKTIEYQHRNNETVKVMGIFASILVLGISLVLPIKLPVKL